MALNSDFTIPGQLIFFDKHEEETKEWCGTGALMRKSVTPEWMEGKSLFKSNCASCHNPKADGTGPALQGVTARWQAGGKYKRKTGEQWLHAWIKNWREVVDAGYGYGVDMANSRESQMNIFTTLNDQQVNDILLYVENPDGGTPQVVNAAMP